MQYVQVFNIFLSQSVLFGCMIKCVALDIGGTLHRRIEKSDLAGKKAQLIFLKKKGFVVSSSSLRLAVEEAFELFHHRRRSRKPLTLSKSILTALGISASSAFAKQVMDVYYFARLKAEGESSLAPGARAFLKLAHKRGILLGIITDNDSSWSKEWVRKLRLPISQYLILISNEIGSGKSSVRPFQLFLKKAKIQIKGLQPHEILMVGNHPRDLNASKIGFKTCYYNAQQKPLLSKNPVPDYTITHFSELKKILAIR